MSELTTASGISMEEYIEAPGFNYSSAKVLMDSPEIFYRRFISKELGEKQTTSMTFGNDLENFLKTGGADDRIRLVPNEVLSKNGTINTNAYRAWRAEQPADTRPMKLSEATELSDKLEAVTDQLHAHSKAMELLTTSEWDIHVTWTCPDTGVLCKGLLDLANKNWRITDLKSTANFGTEEIWRKEIEKYQYHWQAAHYLEGFYNAHCNQEGSILDLDFHHLVIESARPYRVATFQLDDAFREIGHIAMKAAKLRYADYMKIPAGSVWRDPGHGKSIACSPSQYLINRTQDEQSIIDWEAA